MHLVIPDNMERQRTDRRPRSCSQTFMSAARHADDGTTSAYRSMLAAAARSCVPGSHNL